MAQVNWQVVKRGAGTQEAPPPTAPAADFAAEGAVMRADSPSERLLREGLSALPSILGMVGGVVGGGEKRPTFFQQSQSE